MNIISSNVGIFSPSGVPILLHLLRYSAIAVKNHSFMRCASHLQQPRLVNNPRSPELFTVEYNASLNKRQMIHNLNIS
jgi:hypothetical protein